MALPADNANPGTPGNLAGTVKSGSEVDLTWTAAHIVVSIASSLATTVSAIDAVGNRVATGSGGGYGFLVADLHGNTAGAMNATCTAITDAFSYDAESGVNA